MNAQVSYLDGTYSLIHIPLHLYSSLVQPILRVLIPQTQSLNLSTSPSCASEGLTSDHQHNFLNISVTHLECSIVCHSSWASRVFEPVLSTLPKDAARAVSVSKDAYVVLSVISAGLDAGGRVMELSSPLALAGVSIFFITTYYSDFILVPAKARHNVTQALVARGFEMSENQATFVSPTATGSHRRGSSKSATPPRTPPPSNIAELQSRTFDLLRKRNVNPHIDAGLELVQCSGRETSQLGSPEIAAHRPSLSRQVTDHNPSPTNAWLSHVDAKLYTCIISALISQPRFLSLTLAQDDPPSLLIDRTLLPMFGDSLVGDTETRLIPIFLDLGNLPFEATGIVCGVAGRLVQDMNMAGSSELSYLSTARAGAVILSEEQAARALEVLNPLLVKEG